MNDARNRDEEDRADRDQPIHLGSHISWFKTNIRRDHRSRLYRAAGDQMQRRRNSCVSVSISIMSPISTWVET
jgi:hypothetical protein